MVEPLATDDLVFVYGTIDSSVGSNGIDLQAKDECYKSSVDDEDEFFEVVFTLSLPAPTGDWAADQVSFVALQKTVEAGLAAKKAHFTLKQGGATLIDWDPTLATLKAFKHKATVQRTASQFNTNTTAEYRFRVACRTVAPSSVGYRRDGAAETSDPFVERRVVRPVWVGTASPGMAATDNYLANADAYFATKLPTPVAGGAWQKTKEIWRTDEDDREGVCTREYVEHVSGQTKAAIELQTSMLGRRIAIFRTSYTAYAATTATSAFNAGGTGALAWWGAHKPTNVGSGEWVQLYETFTPNTDLDTEASAVFTFWEVVSGLRRYSFSVQRDAAQVKRVRLSGMYMATAAASANANFLANVATIRASVLSVATGSFDSARPSSHEDDQGETAQTWEWTDEWKEGIYPSGPGGTFDANVGGDFTLKISRENSGAARAFLASMPATPLQAFSATYSAAIDKTQTTDMQTLWDTKLQGHCQKAIADRLRAKNVTLVKTVLGLALEGNRLEAFVLGVARSATVTACTMEEEVVENSGNELVPWADGAPWEFYDFDGPPERLLMREARVTYDVAARAREPVPFAKDELASGFQFERTGSIYEKLAQRNKGELELPPGGGWIPLGVKDRRAPDSVGFTALMNEVTLVHTEAWAYAKKLITRPKKPGSTGSG